jgi:hypothetical protein
MTRGTSKFEHIGSRNSDAMESIGRGGKNIVWGIPEDLDSAWPQAMMLLAR